MKIFQDLNGKCHLLTQMYTNFKGVAVEGGLSPDLHVTPLESPAAYSGDEDEIPFGANTGFKALCEPSRWKVEDLLTGFIEVRL